MRILAIETSGRDGSSAALEANDSDTRLVREVLITGQQRTAQILAPKLKQLLEEIDWPAESIDLVAVAAGPGSFTGLRIGVTTAKTFAYAVSAQVIGVNTLSALAERLTHTTGPLWAVMDAQRQELFVAKFEISVGGQRKMTIETHILPRSEWLAGLQSGDTVTGPALRQIQDNLPSGVMIADESHWQPMASSVGRLACWEFQNGQRHDVWKLAPAYYRLSAAEERMAQSANNSNSESSSTGLTK